MNLLSMQSFTGVAGETFDLVVGASALPLTLVQVSPLATRPAAGQLRQPFSLLFQSMSQVVLPQKIYALRNVSLGSIGIFLVPIARAPQGITYQAVFN